MRFRSPVTILFTAFLAVFALGGLHESAAAAEAYRLGPGDAIDVQVFGEPELTRVLQIGADGRINYAFVGEITLQGLTVLEVEQEITRRLLGDYLVNPQVSVTMSEYRPFYIKGQVASPGSFPYQPGLTVARAISLAGGLTERASERKIYLVPEGGLEAERRQVGLDEPVHAGDVITVEESFF